jgi:serine/threonine-protein kinase
MKANPFFLLLFIFLSACAVSTQDLQKTVSPTEAPSPVYTTTPAATPTLTAGASQISPKDGMTLLYVPAGNFSMGSDIYADEKPQRMLKLEAFWIDQTEVSNVLYARCVTEGACKATLNDSSKKSGSENMPVETDNYAQAQAYCTWAGRRLPSEAEWEKAARGTDGRTYPWGEDIDCAKANYAGCKDGVQAVGSYPQGASPYGALDMAGNRWEWVSDVYPASTLHILKGGDWQTAAWGLRSAVRGGDWEAKGHQLWGRAMESYWYDCYGTRTDWYCDFRGNTEAMGSGFRCAMSP